MIPEFWYWRQKNIYTKFFNETVNWKQQSSSVENESSLMTLGTVVGHNNLNLLHFIQPFKHHLAACIKKFSLLSHYAVCSLFIFVTQSGTLVTWSISKMFKMSSPAHAHKDNHIVQMLKRLIRTHIYVSC